MRSTPLWHFFYFRNKNLFLVTTICIRAFLGIDNGLCLCYFIIRSFLGAGNGAHYGMQSPWGKAFYIYGRRAHC